MKFKEALGIDVSKKTIDVILHLSSEYRQFENSNKGFNPHYSCAVKAHKLGIHRYLIYKLI